MLRVDVTPTSLRRKKISDVAFVRRKTHLKATSLRSRNSDLNKTFKTDVFTTSKIKIVLIFLKPSKAAFRSKCDVATTSNSDVAPTSQKLRHTDVRTATKKRHSFPEMTAILKIKPEVLKNFTLEGTGLHIFQGYLQRN